MATRRIINAFQITSRLESNKQCRYVEVIGLRLRVSLLKTDIHLYIQRRKGEK